MTRTALWLVLASADKRPRLATILAEVRPAPPAAEKLLAKPGINPNRQRKGKSGEIPR